MLSLKQIKDICLVNDTTSQKCRYLAQDENDYSKYHCVKRIAGRAKDIDSEIDDYVKALTAKGKDPTKENVPLGDNCAGYPLLRNLEQGYDKP